MRLPFLLYLTYISTAALPAAAQALLPYQDPDKTAEERAEDLTHRLTLEEKVSLMQNDSPALPAYGIPAYNWWSEALHGSARNGLATVFPQAIGMAASFDPDLLREVMGIAATEQRIKYHESRQQTGGASRYHGLTVWTPNINLFRDPRWGRGQETYGEDPYLTYQMGKAAVEGLQGNPEDRIYERAGRGYWREYDRLHACLKHYAVHSGPEADRHRFNVTDLSQRDLAESYLYAFERIVKETDVKEVMCAYNAVDGKPCCGSDALLTQILRKEWGFKGLIVSDCGAIRDFYNGPKVHNTFPNDPAAASANAVMSGTDVECGGSYKHLVEAVSRGAIQETDIDAAVRRLLTARFALGDMDADSLVSWNYIPAYHLASEKSHRKALEMARESVVLLQNQDGTLPLKEGTRIALVGPNAADSLVLWGNYYGTPRATRTVRAALEERFGKDHVQYHALTGLVTRDVFTSLFDHCTTENGKKGFSATYYTGTRHEGTPLTTAFLSAPWQFCTGGATVFAPNVPLQDFSARYTSTFHATQDGELLLNAFVCGQGQFIVAGDTIARFRTGHGARPCKGTVKVKAGHDYPITLNFAYLIPEAQFNFDLGYMSQPNIEDVVKATASADVYVFVGGISPSLEGEEMKVPYEGFSGGDRTDIELPRVQREAIARLAATGKPVVLVNMSGSAMGLEPETSVCKAILQAWYGGEQGGQAITDVLAGDYNPSGRLPITFYRHTSDLPPFTDYNMAGHTYRHFKGKPLFPFGFGLSYSQFSYGEARFRRRVKDYGTSEDSLACSVVVKIKNISPVDGTEVVQVYLHREDDMNAPSRTLRGFLRVDVPAGEEVEAEVPIYDMRTYDPKTCTMRFQTGQYTIFYGSSSNPRDLHYIKTYF